MATVAGSQGRFGTAFDWLGIERAWLRTRGQADVCIGIVDQGVQRDHPLLSANLRRDHSIHAAAQDSDEIAGTQAAGVAAGMTSEQDHFSGVAPEARILPVRFALRPGPRSLDVAHAIEYAAEMGASVIYLSHLADLSTASVLRAIQYAATRNALVVCTARHALRPAQAELAPNLISVLAVDERRAPLERSPAGAVHLAAPGFARVPEWRGSGAVSVVGASLGAAYVSGCAALIKSLNPGLGYLDIKEHLLASAMPCHELRDLCRTGALLDVGQAVLGPIEHAGDARPLSWSSLTDVELQWNLRYRSSLCANIVALFRPAGDEHWRELGHARARDLRMTIPSGTLRRASGTLRIASRDSNFFAEDRALTIL
jgi:hypothetical protein